jgi:hypothetical protein
MRPRAFVFALIVTAVSSTAPDGYSQDTRQMGGVGLTIFAEPDFRGRSATIRQDTPDFRRINMNDITTSLQVAAGEQWEVCEHANYRGRCIVVSGSERDLSRTGWNGIISSARRVRGSAGIVPPVQSRGLELFTNTNFSGTRRVFMTAEPDLRRVNFNRSARSLRIPRGEVWQVCSDTNYRNCVAVNTDWRDLAGLNMSRRISSIRPWGAGGGVVGTAFIVLFDNRSYRGQSFRVDRTTSDLGGFANRARSVQVTGSPWELCERTSFRGRCSVVTRNLPDLASIGMSGRVASVRPAAATPR